MKLPKNHPFIVEAFELEKIEAEKGLDKSLIEKRIKLANRYPEYYNIYMKSKGIKQEERLYNERKEKLKQIRDRGGEVISYYKNKFKN
jgi:hypothetical protein